MRIAQAKRREKRRESGKVMLEVPISPELRNAIKNRAEKEEIRLWDLIEKVLKEFLEREK